MAEARGKREVTKRVTDLSEGELDPRPPSAEYALDSIWLANHNLAMAWIVALVDEFEPEFDALPPSVQDELLAQARVIEHFGPAAGRPRVGTLKGSRHANMKELRFDADGGVWRVAFAFDPRRHAVLLVAGDKSGGSEKRFYARLLAKADQRFDTHLQRSAPKGK